MRRSITFLAILLVTLSAHAQSFPPESDTALATEHFWADIEFRPGTNITVAKFRAWFEQPPAKVFPVLIDTNKLPAVHSNYKDAAVLTEQVFEQIIASKPANTDELAAYLATKAPVNHGRQSGGTWTRYEYLNFDFPWPLANRWTVQEARVDESHGAEGVYRYDYEMHAGNFKTLKGYWEIAPVDGKPGWTEFRGSYESDAGIALPKALTKAAAKTGIKRDVEDNRRVLASK